MWREQLQLLSPALLRARRRATVPTLCSTLPLFTAEIRRVLTRVLVPTCVCFNVLPASAPRAMIQSPPPALFLAIMAQS